MTATDAVIKQTLPHTPTHMHTFTNTEHTHTDILTHIKTFNKDVLYDKCSVGEMILYV